MNKYNNKNSRLKYNYAIYFNETQNDTKNRHILTLNIYIKVVYLKLFAGCIRQLGFTVCANKTLVL